MYVIYPAEELLKIYETPIRSVPLNNNRENSLTSQIDRSNRDQRQCEAVKKSTYLSNCSYTNDINSNTREQNLCNNRGISVHRKKTYNSGSKSLSGKNNNRRTVKDRVKSRNCPIMQNNRNNGDEGSNPLKELTHANLNDPLKQYSGNALKLVHIVSEFAQEFGNITETHGANIRRLVEEFRTRSGEVRGDTGGMRRVWENLLRQAEADASTHLDLATALKQLSMPTEEASFPRKIQSRKVFAHREAYEQVVSKTDEKLQRERINYKRAYESLLKYNGNDGGVSGAGIKTEEEYSSLRQAYLEAHNAYVLQLRATNAINEYYQLHCLPSLLGEIAEVYEEVSGLTCNCVAGICEATSERASEQLKRYQLLIKEAQSVVPSNDLQALAKNLSATVAPRKPVRRLFVPPTSPEQVPADRLSQVPTLRDELVSTGSSVNQTILDNLRREAEDLSLEIGRLRDSLDALTRMQRKSAEGSLFTKVAELQEDISLKRFDLGVAHLHLAAVQAQKELFGSSDIGPDGLSGRKMSNGSTGSNTKHKWLKAFKSLKTSSPVPQTGGEKKNLESEGGHQWREYTYRKITPCDACGQVLRGHSRQGLRCRACKANAHADCINLIRPVNCPSLAPKRTGGIPLLRRQKNSTHVDDTPVTEHTGVDATYQVLKQAGEIRGNSTNSPPTPPTVDHSSSGGPLSARTSAASHPCSSSTSGMGPEYETGSGSSSGTRPSGQPLVLIPSEDTLPPVVSRQLSKKQSSGRKR